jgi:hypothetical protein
MIGLEAVLVVEVPKTHSIHCLLSLELAEPMMLVPPRSFHLSALGSWLDGEREEVVPSVLQMIPQVYLATEV